MESVPLHGLLSNRGRFHSTKATVRWSDDLDNCIFKVDAPLPPSPKAPLCVSASPRFTVPAPKVSTCFSCESPKKRLPSTTVARAAPAGRRINERPCAGPLITAKGGRRYGGKICPVNHPPRVTIWYTSTLWGGSSIYHNRRLVRHTCNVTFFTFGYGTQIGSLKGCFRQP